MINDVYVVGTGVDNMPNWLALKIAAEEISVTVDVRGDWLVQLPDRALLVPKGAWIALYEDDTIYFDAVEVRFNG